MPSGHGSPGWHPGYVNDELSDELDLVSPMGFAQVVL